SNRPGAARVLARMALLLRSPARSRQGLRRSNPPCACRSSETSMLPGRMPHIKRATIRSQNRRKTFPDSRSRRTPMRGLMMDVPLMISSLIRHADRYHGDTEIVSRTVEGPIHRYTYRDAHTRARRLARALSRLGVAPGDRVGTLAWN